MAGDLPRERFDTVCAAENIGGLGPPDVALLGLRPRLALRFPRRERRLLGQLRPLDRRRWASVLVLEAPCHGREFRHDVGPARRPGAQQLGWKSAISRTSRLPSAASPRSVNRTPIRSISRVSKRVL